MGLQSCAGANAVEGTGKRARARQLISQLVMVLPLGPLRRAQHLPSGPEQLLP